MTYSASATLALSIVLAVPVALRTVAAAQDQDTFTPMPLDRGFGPIDDSAPAVPADEIIRRFAAKETDFEQALSHYTWRREAHVQTISNAVREVDGEWSEVDDVLLGPDGTHMEKAVYAPPSTLRRILLTPTDMEDIEHGYPFVLTTADLPGYDITYVGHERVDEIFCYVFDVSPRQMLKGHRYLQGRIWVDDHDFQIVITDGRMIPDGTKKGQGDLHPPFMTWRELIDGQYWFPTYVKGEGILHFAATRHRLGADVHVRVVVKYTAYERSPAIAQSPPSPTRAQK